MKQIHIKKVKFKEQQNIFKIRKKVNSFSAVDRINPITSIYIAPIRYII